MPVDVASLRIVHYPAAVLRAKAKPIAPVNPPTDEVRAVARRMLEIMREEQGIGLAAPQVGLSWRLFIVDVPPPSAKDGDDKDAKPPKDSTNGPRTKDLGLPVSSPGPQYYINPTFTNPQGAPIPWEEGCLSLPDIRGDVLRPPVITISAIDLNGTPFTQTATGLLARCWQHEMDHLDGVLIIDKMTQMSRIKNRKAIKDLES